MNDAPVLAGPHVGEAVNGHQPDADTPTGGPAPLFHLTDAGNADRLVYLNPNDLLYCDVQKCWYIWDNTRFALDDTQEIIRRARAAALWILYEESRRAEDKDVREKIASHALRSESASRLNAMATLAQSDPDVAVRPSALDRNPWLFNVMNGTIDCRTGELRPHSRKDRITKRSPVEYDPAAQCPGWLKFLDRVMDGNEPKISYLQRFFGYCLTGQTTEDALLFAWGTGRNGKSTAIDTIKHVMGDYATGIQAETIMLRDKRDNTHEIAMLQGARFVHMVEIEEGARMAESLVKQLTGGDDIRARKLYAQSFTFRPEFKLVIAGNHKPAIKGTDIAIWSRIHLVPFTVTIQEEEVDPELESKLERESSGILNWMLEGCNHWRHQGLNPPAEIRWATQQYREEQDVIGMFLRERCIMGPEFSVLFSDIYDAYKSWHEDQGLSPRTLRSRIAFTRDLGDRGIAKEPDKTVNKRITCHGIGILSSLQQADLGPIGSIHTPSESYISSPYRGKLTQTPQNDPNAPKNTLFEDTEEERF